MMHVGGETFVDSNVNSSSDWYEAGSGSFEDCFYLEGKIILQVTRFLEDDRIVFFCFRCEKKYSASKIGGCCSIISCAGGEISILCLLQCSK